MHEKKNYLDMYDDMNMVNIISAIAGIYSTVSCVDGIKTKERDCSNSRNKKQARA